MKLQGARRSLPLERINTKPRNIQLFGNRRYYCNVSKVRYSMSGELTVSRLARDMALTLYINNGDREFGEIHSMCYSPQNRSSVDGIDYEPCNDISSAIIMSVASINRVLKPDAPLEHCFGTPEVIYHRSGDDSIDGSDR